MIRFASLRRVAALAVLFLYGGIYSAANVLDAMAAAQANGSLAHIETDSGPECAAHNETLCQLCRVRIATWWRAPAAPSVVVSFGHVPVEADSAALRVHFERVSLHSRAPPIA